jgi:hypothetical protein
MKGIRELAFLAAERACVAAPAGALEDGRRDQDGNRIKSGQQAHCKKI